ncbi:DUF6417 family protein [Streptomyces sp. NPDC006446]|uniref:DUF6417 family protein n=1 Tax=Streptomyces sp. NPDC006446 TaxID=3154301 RepID=UPI0033AAB3D8
MDDYEKIDLDELVFAPMEHTTERLALLTLQEAHDVLRLLLVVAEKEEGPVSVEATGWLVRLPPGSPRRTDTLLSVPPLRACPGTSGRCTGSPP